METATGLSTFCGRVAAWMFAAVGLAITYEVVMRYVFGAPTIWAEEVARMAQIWACYLAAAMLLGERKMIRVTLVTDRLPARAIPWAEAISLLWIAGFCLVAVWFGATVALESVRIGRASPTMLGIPQWATESAIPIGFGLLFVQALAQLGALARTVRGTEEPRR